MKKQKLALSKETIRQLDGSQLSEVGGGSIQATGPNCRVVGSGVCNGQYSIVGRCGSGIIIILPPEQFP